jgi:hypothetical protein
MAEMVAVIPSHRRRPVPDQHRPDVAVVFLKLRRRPRASAVAATQGHVGAGVGGDVTPEQGVQEAKILPGRRPCPSASPDGSAARTRRTGRRRGWSRRQQPVPRQGSPCGRCYANESLWGAVSSPRTSPVLTTPTGSMSIA